MMDKEPEMGVIEHDEREMREEGQNEINGWNKSKIEKKLNLVLQFS